MLGSADAACSALDAKFVDGDRDGADLARWDAKRKLELAVI